MLAHVSAISKIGGRRASAFPGWTLGSPQEGAPYRRTPARGRRELHSCNSATSAPLQGSRRIAAAHGTPDLEIPGTSYIVFTRWNARKCRERQRITLQKCGRSSAGRAPPCQGGCREFESRRPLARHCQARILRNHAYTVGWPRGEAAACKAVYTGSNPVSTSRRAPRGSLNPGDWRSGSALP